MAELPVAVEDALRALLLLLPAVVTGVAVLRGLAPGAVIGAMLRRARGANAVFVGLIAAALALGLGLTAQERGLRQGTARAADRFDLVVAAPGSEITAMLAAVYLQPADMALIDGTRFDEIARAPGVVLAAPVAFGDSVDGAPVVGTTAGFVHHLAWPPAEGRMFAALDEAVVGAEVAARIGEEIEPAHGTGAAADHDAHEGHHFHVTGRLARSGTPWDRAVIVPIEAVWEVHAMPTGHAPGDDRIGPPFDPAAFPGTPAVIVHVDQLSAAYALKSRFTRPDLMAFFPGTVLAQLHGLLGDVRRAMSAMALLTQALVTVAVLAGLAILTHLFARQLALLRAVGAPGRFVFAVVWGHAAALIVTGAVLGGLLALGATRLLSAWLSARTGVAIAAGLGWAEAQMLAGFVSLMLVAALLPAWAALRRPVLPALR